jgi:hypothetical protein
MGGCRTMKSRDSWVTPTPAASSSICLLPRPQLHVGRLEEGMRCTPSLFPFLCVTRTPGWPPHQLSLVFAEARISQGGCGKSGSCGQYGGQKPES